MAAALDHLVMAFDLNGNPYNRDSAARFEEHFSEFLEGYTCRDDLCVRYHNGYYLALAADFVDNKVTQRPEFEDIREKDEMVLDRIRPQVGLRNGFPENNWQDTDLGWLEACVKALLGQFCVKAGTFRHCRTLMECQQHLLKAYGQNPGYQPQAVQHPSRTASH